MSNEADHMLSACLRFVCVNAHPEATYACYLCGWRGDAWRMAWRLHRNGVVVGPICIVCEPTAALPPPGVTTTQPQVMTTDTQRQS